MDESNDSEFEYSLADAPIEVFTHPPGKPLEFDDGRLAALPRGLQRVAMIEWFTARFCDPAEETPYNGREGGYQFIHGGPFDPADELPDRFGGVLDDMLIDEAVEHLHAEVGHEWAPMRAYDEAFDVEVDAADAPFEHLLRRLADAQRVMGLRGDVQAERLVVHSAYSAVITALESYLWETLAYWIDADERVLHRLVTGFDEFKGRTVKLGDVFKRVAGLRQEVRGYLQGFIWHRWHDVARLYKAGFGIEVPSFDALEGPLLVRHDIVHRNSRTREGEPIELAPADVAALAQTVERLARALQNALPCPPSDFDGVSDADP